MNDKIHYNYENIPENRKTFKDIALNRFLWIISFLLIVLLVILLFPLISDTYSWYKQLDSNVIRFLCIIEVFVIFLLIYHFISTLFPPNSSETKPDDSISDKFKNLFIKTADYLGLLLLIVSLIIQLYSIQYTNNIRNEFLVYTIPLILFIILLNPIIYPNLKLCNIKKDNKDDKKEYNILLILILAFIFIICSIFLVIVFFKKILTPPSILFFSAISLFIGNLLFKCEESSPKCQKWAVFLPVIIIVVFYIGICLWWKYDPHLKEIREANIIISRFDRAERLPINVTTSGFATSRELRMDKLINNKLNRIIVDYGLFCDKEDKNHSIKVANTNKIIKNYKDSKLFFTKLNTKTTAIIWGFNTSIGNKIGAINPLCTYRAHSNFGGLKPIFQDIELTNYFLKNVLSHSIPGLMPKNSEWELDAWLTNIILIQIARSYYDIGDEPIFNIYKGIQIDKIVQNSNFYTRILSKKTKENKKSDQYTKQKTVFPDSLLLQQNNYTNLLIFQGICLMNFKHVINQSLNKENSIDNLLDIEHVDTHNYDYNLICGIMENNIKAIDKCIKIKPWGFIPNFIDLVAYSNIYLEETGSTKKKSFEEELKYILKTLNEITNDLTNDQIKISAKDLIEKQLEGEEFDTLKRYFETLNNN